MPLTPRDIADCIQVLEALVEDRGELAAVDPDTCNRLLIAAGRVSRPERLEQRLLSRALRKKKAHVKRKANEAKLERTGIRRQRRFRCCRMGLSVAERCAGLLRLQGRARAVAFLLRSAV
jgi:hypothetical protein